MDEFEVLTERFGLKPQGKSAPMAASKGPTSSSNVQSPNFGFDSGLNPKSSSYSSRSSPHSTTISQNFGGFDDYSDLLVGGPSKSTKQSNNSFDYDSIFSNNSTARPSFIYDNDDIFGGMPGLKSSVSIKNDDVFASFATPPKQSAPIEDLLGNLGGREANSKSSSRNGSVHSESDFDDLIPGFGGSSSPYNGNTTNQPQQALVHSTISSKDPFVEDPFAVLESISKPAYTSSDVFSDPLEQMSKLNNSGGKRLGASSNAIPPLRPPPKPTQVPKAEKVKSSCVSSIDELEDFAMGRVRNKAGERSHVRTSERVVKPSAAKSSRYNEAEDASLRNLQNGGDDLESFFSVGPRSNSVPRSRATNFDSAFDASVHKGGSEVPQRVPSEVSASIKKSHSATFIVDDLSLIFGAAPLFGEFQEVEGETEERRRARWERHQRTQKRAAQAVADMNQRDLQTQQEQEERHRIAETVDVAIKRWAAGREGNMRALLSSLQNVLGPECGWQPVSLTDIITSASVKKVYRKATLCIHPDKIQQRGASLEQKYTAEKVFDILKVPYKHFSHLSKEYQSSVIH
ncbi:Auxilin-related protein 1 [Morella rubra]|uniref:Auxilin-related protein 1 n=1 Tax=Morella rubra TaxID=262757 RepID=A0A6A1UKQ1_9ROSI|nr:Auxilin-related protein 1 [Morella rubra]KAB1200528.1 Auxilin-related protein 1 [Morella rubra]